MAQLTISGVARKVGLRPSAIRYYERLGILFPAERKSGQRRYDNTTVYRLAVIQHARQTGFTLDEIRQLFFGFDKGTSPGKRWQEMSRRKLAELQQLSDQIETMKSLLNGIQNCHCDALNECGEKLLRRGRLGIVVKRLPLGRG
jgi:MerR family transcriptional regulator, redox-sensitive transcriptional activator SoxR